MFKVQFAFLSCVLGVITTLELPEKCDVKDTECKKLMYQKIFIQATDGVPAMNIPNYNPMHLGKAVFTLPNAVKFILDEGIVIGLKSCTFDTMSTHLTEPMHTFLNMTCNMVVDGLFTVIVPKPALKLFAGVDEGPNIVVGHCNGRVVIDKLRVGIIFPFHFVRRRNEIYLNTASNLNIFYEAGSVVFTSDNLIVGNKAIGQRVVKYINDHTYSWDLVSIVSHKILEFFKSFASNYLSKVPAKKLYTTDLSTYATNEY
ncbi:uncharacterized protein LOC142976080 [Anticarsia gemmatalis]|uniref:uncharacterized protein LOC142976080 n=1 Tax=Anticarsia gemmatalis TaxID=129554 RepID=UPI003F7697A7